MRSGTLELFDDAETARADADAQHSGPLEAHLQKHIDSVRAQLHASASQHAQLDEMRAHVKQLQLQLLQGEKRLDDQAYTCKTLEQKFEKARDAETAARSDLAAAKAQLEQQERESLQALQDLRDEFAQRHGAADSAAAAGQANSDGDDDIDGAAAAKTAGGEAAAAGDVNSARARRSRHNTADAQTMADAGADAGTAALLRSINFLRAQLLRHKALGLPPLLDVAPLRRARQQRIAAAQHHAKLRSLRFEIASRTISVNQ